MIIFAIKFKALLKPKRQLQILTLTLKLESHAFQNMSVEVKPTK